MYVCCPVITMAWEPFDPCGRVYILFDGSTIPFVGMCTICMFGYAIMVVVGWLMKMGLPDDGEGPMTVVETTLLEFMAVLLLPTTAVEPMTVGFIPAACTTGVTFIVANMAGVCAVCTMPGTGADCVFVAIVGDAFVEAVVVNGPLDDAEVARVCFLQILSRNGSRF